ncbi:MULTISPECIES: slipin family protein [Streptomyces]|uniref:Slipin family protein n=1 Tax=Streptomyces changanensis TaxID=2964669 RepID=A0ABY5NB16_9ACTN|nr:MULTISPECIES: slipin family protein [Streptomyces]UUS33225.1 slipin family protein [Streptomyces changanensis]
MVEEALTAVILAGAAGGAYLAAAARVVKQYEQGVVLRLGRLRSRVRGPGLTMIVPFVDRMRKVSMQIVTMPVPAQDGITRDNVTVRVDAVIYFKVVDPVDAVIRVEDYRFAVSQIAQTSLRSIIGKSELDDLLSNREKLNEGLELMIDSPAVEWGVTIDRVEIKDVSLPETMKRSMARQAEADRERRARLINADAEFQASKKLSEAAREMADTPSALQLRLLQTVMAVAAEKNSTLVLPIPVELLRFLERSAERAEYETGRHGRDRGDGSRDGADGDDGHGQVAAARGGGAEARDGVEARGGERAPSPLGPAGREPSALDPAGWESAAHPLGRRPDQGHRESPATHAAHPAHPVPPLRIRDEDAGTAGCL